ncbi:MAG: L-lactate dehydrogenase, partial [Demequinaceae bacterium]|nr:L-lactate dehydrogenase [Demequinaceae bacterium]
MGTQSGGSKVSIVGAGLVGSTLAYACLMQGLARTVALFDIDTAKVEAEALDLVHGIQFMPQAEVLGSDDVAVCADSDMVVITAGAKQQPGQSRLDLAAATIGLMDKILPPVMEVAPEAIYLLVTNPVDVVTFAAIKKSGMTSQRMFGSGTVLDSSRLRYRIAQECGVAVANVHAYIAGEHGDSEVALWSSASIG